MEIPLDRPDGMGQAVGASRPKASAFRSATVQVAAFMSNAENLSQTKVLTTILSKFDERFDGQVDAMSLPPDAPPEIPRVQLQSQDGMWRLTASPQRLDVYWVGTSSQGSLTTEYDDSQVISLCSEVIEHCVRKWEPEIKVERVALVLNRFFETSNPAQILIDRFCNEDARNGPFVRSRAFEIHNQKRYTPDIIGLEINSWVRCKSVTLLPRGNTAILVEQDLNTPDDRTPEQGFDANRVGQYYKQAKVEADGILRVYFPEEG